MFLPAATSIGYLNKSGMPLTFHYVHSKYAGIYVEVLEQIFKVTCPQLHLFKILFFRLRRAPWLFFSKSGMPMTFFRFTFQAKQAKWCCLHVPRQSGRRSWKLCHDGLETKLCRRRHRRRFENEISALNRRQIVTPVTNLAPVTNLVTKFHCQTVVTKFRRQIFKT